MNILVVSEQFLSGGLETRMDVFYNYLKSKHNIVFAFGKYDGGRYLLDADNVYTGFHFNFHSTISEFLEDVDGLKKLIHENTIDAVIVQPFYSLFPAAFAANQADVPVLYMVHGRTSLNFNNIRNADILFLVSLEFLVTAIGTVSKKYNSWVESVKRDKNVIYLPNAIDSRLLTEHKLQKKMYGHQFHELIRTIIVR